MFKKPPAPEVHALTVAEVDRQTAAYSARRNAVTAELARIFAGRQAGDPVEQPLPDHVKAARARAMTLLNGFAPSSLTAPRAMTRERELLVERDALDIVLAALSRSEVIARAADAVQWAED